MDPSAYQTLSPVAAIAQQFELVKQVNLTAFEGEINSIGGADCSSLKYSKRIYAGVVLMSYPVCSVRCKVGIVAETKFPYLPGLLAFREVPALLAAWNLLIHPPDILMLDGQGIAHPRRMGIASHFGILADVPTLGVAKTRLFGQYEEPSNRSGAYTALMDKDEQVGWVYRSKKNCKPLFVSPGHKISIMQSLELVQRCMAAYRIPEPTRKAHMWVNEFRKSESITSIQTSLFPED